jgi:hypothetical protein
VKVQALSPLPGMHSSDTNNPVDSFTLELLRSGVALSDLAGELIDAMPADAYPGEDLSEVVLGMISGSISAFLSETDAAEVERATELISGALDRVLEHLQLALELRRRMESDAGERGPDIPDLFELDVVDVSDELDELDELEDEPASAELDDEPAPAEDADPFEALAGELLDCGGVLSQLIAGMIARQASAGEATEYMAIPEGARALLRQVLGQVRERHSQQDAATAAAIVGEVTNVLTNEVFFVNPEWN